MIANATYDLAVDIAGHRIVEGIMNVVLCGIVPEHAFSAGRASQADDFNSCGRMASSCNQRHSVLPLMEATKPLCWTCCTRSVVLHRDSGRSYFAGTSQAKALICTTSRFRGQEVRVVFRQWGNRHGVSFVARKSIRHSLIRSRLPSYYRCKQRLRPLLRLVMDI